MRPRPYWPRSVVTDPPKAGSVCRIEAHALQRPTSSRRRRVDQNDKPDTDVPGLVFRLDVYVGERDSYGVGFSHNVIFRKQYYVQVFPRAGGPAVFVHTGGRFLGSNDPQYEAELGLSPTTRPTGCNSWHATTPVTGRSPSTGPASPEDSASQSKPTIDGGPVGAAPRL